MKIIESQYVSIGQPQYYGYGSDWEYNGSCYSQYQTGSVVYNCLLVGVYLEQYVKEMYLKVQWVINNKKVTYVTFLLIKIIKLRVRK